MELNFGLRHAQKNIFVSENYLPIVWLGVVNTFEGMARPIYHVCERCHTNVQLAYE